MRALNRSKPIVFIGLLLALSASQIASAADKVFDKKLNATPGGRLTVQSDSGTIVVTGVEAKEVTVHVSVEGSRSQVDDFEITAEDSPAGVSVRGRRRSDWWLDLSWAFGQGLRVKYEINVPTNYHLDLRTAGGAIETRDIEGDVTGRTSGGSLRLSNVKGRVELHTSGGGIRAEQLSGNSVLRTSGGSVTIVDAKGDVDARTSGGSIRLEQVDGRVYARTSGGSIDASLLGENRGVELRTSGGSIRVAVPTNYKASIDAHTSGGKVRSDLPLTGEREDRDSRNDLSGDLNGGGPALVARTSGGSIRIYGN